MVDFELVKNPIEHHVIQGSDEWKLLRVGLITGSHFGDIMPAERSKDKKAFTQGQKTYLRKVAGEILTGESADSDFTSKHMDDGHLYEPIARQYFSDFMMQTVRECGFFQFSDMVGDSPDGLVGSEGSEYATLEIKCPAVHTHLHYLEEPDFFWKTYKWQALGHILCSRRDTGFLVSYNHFMPESKRMVLCECPKGYKDDIKRLEERLFDACAIIAGWIK